MAIFVSILIALIVLGLVGFYAFVYELGRNNKHSLYDVFLFLLAVIELVLGAAIVNDVDNLCLSISFCVIATIFFLVFMGRFDKGGAENRQELMFISGIIFIATGIVLTSYGIHYNLKIFINILTFGLPAFVLHRLNESKERKK